MNILWPHKATGNAAHTAVQQKVSPGDHCQSCSCWYTRSNPLTHLYSHQQTHGPLDLTAKPRPTDLVGLCCQVAWPCKPAALLLVAVSVLAVPPALRAVTPGGPAATHVGRPVVHGILDLQAGWWVGGVFVLGFGGV